MPERLDVFEFENIYVYVIKKCVKLTTVTQLWFFFVNGKKIEDAEVDPEWTLLYYLRNKLRLCGTKLGCGEGGCGACTVMVSKYDRINQKEIHIPVNACLAPICSMHGCAVTTVEGIGSTKTKLHPVQERIAKAHGIQCGFCTPGIVMSMYTLLRQKGKSKPTMKDIEIAFQGNLCRCTGYRPIIDGFRTFTEEWERAQAAQSTNLNGRANGNSNGCGMGDKCCKLTNGKGCGVKDEDDEELFKTNEFIPYHPSQEPIFPPELKVTNKYDQQYLIIKGKNTIWYRPTELDQFLELKHRYSNAKIVVGNTEVGVEIKFKQMEYPIIIQPNKIAEMTTISKEEGGIKIGASTTLNDLQNFLQSEVDSQPEYKTRIFKSIVDMLNNFAGKQIRSVSAVGGNIMTGSPISDLIPILMATKVEMEVQSFKNGIRKVALDNNFFTGYRKSTVQPEEVLLSIFIPYTTEDQYFEAFKQARRREDDIAIVNTAINVTFKPKSHIISKISLAFGGMSFKTITAPKTEAKLKGLPWDRTTLEKAYTYLLEDLPLDPGAPGGMIQYRKSLTLSLFFKAFLCISQKLQLPATKLDQRELSGASVFQPIELKSSQFFAVVPDSQKTYDPVQRPMVGISAYKLASGEATFVDDLPFLENEAHLGFVISSKPHANILSIDSSEALAMEGVYGIVSADDLRDDLVICNFMHQEYLPYSKKVTSEGQIIAAIVAKDKITAKKAAKRVKVQYEELEPVIVTIDEAIRLKSFFGQTPHRLIKKGDVDEVFKTAPHILEGECKIGGQEHFYMETQSVLAVPKGEDDEMDVYLATQNPGQMQSIMAGALGVQMNKINCKVKRIGGGFGGKEVKPAIIAVPAVLAARKFNRPIRCMLDRDEDIVMTGGRHPFHFKYKVAFDDNGKILGCTVDMYCNAGHADNTSLAVVEHAMINFGNSYNIPVVRIAGYGCKTNIASNTAYRGFGSPQGMFACEYMVEEIAQYLNKDSMQVRAINLLQEGDITYCNQEMFECTLDKCWEELQSLSNYQERRELADKFNRENKYKKRGMCIVPTVYGIAFPVPFLNQASALVLIYTDGSVLLCHGGVEMGQGLSTKMVQVASRCLDIPVELIHTSEVQTDKIPNASPTAASYSSDLFGMAIMDACNQLNARLKPFKEKLPNGKWEDWVKAAYFDRVSLSASGFFQDSGLNYDWEKNEGKMYKYYSIGACCSEVEIDTLTGDHQVLRTDIVMDVGQSLNPAIDIGQIEGGFVQGYGLYVLEELVYSPNGTNYTRGPGTYKLPGFGDIPGEFNVSLLKGVSNPRAVFSSKAIGEPPLFFASSVFYAIRDAIKAARLENGISTRFRLDAPATSAKIRMACQDDITNMIPEAKPGSFTQ